VRGKIMFPCNNPSVVWDDSERRAGAEYESYRGEAATGDEEILEIDSIPTTPTNLTHSTAFVFVRLLLGDS
jgi:hypothetical protein